MRRFVLALLLSTGASNAQSFDAVDVHASITSSTTVYMRGGVMRGGRMEIRTGSLLDLISLAYDVGTTKVVGGPTWLGNDRFDLVAGAPASTNQETARKMLQSMLADRFALKIHKEMRPMPAFVLSPGRAKHKMKPATSDGPSTCKDVSQPAAANTGAFTELQCRNITMGQFIDTLRNFAGVYLPAAVFDETALAGAFDFDFKFHQRNQLAAAGGEATNVFDAVDRQLSLKLEPQNRPQEAMVVESINRNPTPNPPGVVSKLPPAPPAEFEVAIVKRSPPDVPPRGKVEGGRVDAEGLTLKQLIMIAWDLNNDQLVANLPKFADTNKFSITAQAPIPEGATSITEVDEISLLQMVRNLIQDRFQMKSHMEERPVEGYVLSAPKPKLDKADPAGRTECKEGPGKDGKDPRNTNPILNRLMTCTNMTMAQFAEQLPLRVNGYVRTAVLNSTGLDGPYDFTLSFSGVNLYNASTADNPNGAISLAEAADKQLGLKLALEKRPMPVLVIDHLEENPTEN